MIPGALFLVVLLLSSLFLGWYLRPGPRSQVAPTGQSGLVELRLRGTPFAVPANYIENAKARSGGDMDSLTLVALFPSWQGYSESQARLFASNAPDSAAVRLSLRGDVSGLGARERLERIYRPSLTDAAGETGPFGLTQYRFAPDSGYGDDDLFAADGPSELMLFLCERPSAQFPSPNCLAIDRRLTPELSYSYRFKRAYLGRWREIATGVDQLIARFRQH